MTRAKRGFAAINKMRSGRYQVRYTAPSGARVTAGRTFATKVAAERPGPPTDAARSTVGASTPRSPSRSLSPPTPPPGSRAATSPADPSRPAPASTTRTSSMTTCCPRSNRQLGAIRPADVRDWHAGALVDRPTMRSHAYSLLRTIMASAVNDELIDANPARIVGAGRTTRVHKIRPASIEELGVLTEAMPERLRLMVTLASWCALRFGETIELRRGDVDLSAEVTHTTGRGPHRRRLHHHHPQIGRRCARRRHPTPHHPGDRGPPRQTR